LLNTGSCPILPHENELNGASQHSELVLPY
jgi:hypothetical protein